MKRKRALNALASAFHGRLAAEPDWMELFEAANHALVTPRLYEALIATGAAAAMPQDAAAFIGLIDARNDDRNVKLRTMALDAVEALNGAGITPIYLKGMAVWAACRPAAERFPRMMSDVDLLIEPGETDRGIDALLARGFKLLNRYDDDHVVAELWREGDVGIVDLHLRPPGPPGLVAAFNRAAHTMPAEWPGSARMPTPALQLYLTFLHDMFHDGGFWRGGFDVRHLCDIADLVHGPQGVDWDVLNALLRTRLARNAAHSQLVAAHRIVAAAIPRAIGRRAIPRVHHRRHAAQYLHPQLAFPLALLGIGLEGFNLRQHWPHLGAEGLTATQLLWWLHRGRAYPNKI